MANRGKKSIIIQKNDSKSRKWGLEGPSLGLEFFPQTGSAIKAPLFLLKFIISRGRPSAYVIRYLNDYPSLIRTIARFGAECLLLLLCFILRVKVYWICHNVDRESHKYFPFWSRLRRHMVASRAERIFVTDLGLVSHAKKTLPSQEQKIEAISFGLFEWSEKCSGVDLDFLTSIIEQRKAFAQEKKFKYLTMLCAGSYVSGKTLHYETMIEFIEESKKLGYYILAIIAGNFENSSWYLKLNEQYESSSNIVFLKEYTVFPHSFIKKHIDFYYRGYSDFSVPYTVYEAATLEKPILALNSGFLPEMIKFYRLGAVVERNYAGLKDAFDNLLKVPDNNYKEFLERNKWSSLVNSLKKYID